MLCVTAAAFLIVFTAGPHTLPAHMQHMHVYTGAEFFSYGSVSFPDAFRLSLKGNHSCFTEPERRNKGRIQAQGFGLLSQILYKALRLIPCAAVAGAAVECAFLKRMIVNFLSFYA